MSAAINTNFLLYSISKTLLDILAIFEKNSLATAGKKFIKLLFDKIIDVEKKLTKFDIRKILKFGKNTDVDVNVNEVDVEVTDTSGDYDIVNIDVDIYEDEDAEVDIFSINDMDVEMDDDNLYNDVEDRMR
jgi:hypothetical protein